MKQVSTVGIVLARVDYGEADRIITVLTSHGKLALMAKGVRRPKSKLAGGIELFSVSELVYIPGKGSVSSLVSSRLTTHYGEIVKDITRTMLGYELIALVHKITEDDADDGYFETLQQTFVALNDATIPKELVRLWCEAQLLKLTGTMPNLSTDVTGAPLKKEVRYNFDFDKTAFKEHAAGAFGTNEIKYLRLLFAGLSPKTLTQVEGAHTERIAPLMLALAQYHLAV